MRRKKRGADWIDSYCEGNCGHEDNSRWTRAYSNGIAAMLNIT